MADIMRLDKRAKFRKLCESVEGLTSKDARLLSSIEDKVGAPVKRWPEHCRSSMLGSRLGFKERFSLYLFVVGNQCPPELFVDWVIQRKLLRYTNSAQHMINVIRSHQTGKLEEEGKTYWDMASWESMVIITPSFASETDENALSLKCETSPSGVEYMPPGSAFWESAIEKLEQHQATLPREP